MGRIYLSPPHVGDEERAMLLDAFDSNWIAPLGPHVDAFEQELAQSVGLAAAAALSSGTAALHLALQILGVGPGDPVLVSSLTFAATANAIRYLDAEPVFIDSAPNAWNLDPTLLQQALDACASEGRPAKAVIAVDLYGQCADFQRIVPICKSAGVSLIEDAAEALGATCAGRPAGSFGDISIFSFNGNKIITTSGGGMLVSDRTEWVERARFLATQAREPVAHYEHREIGFNYRMSNLLAAVGRAQLRRLEQRVQARRAIEARYREGLTDLQGISFLPEPAYGTSSGWLSCIMVQPERFGASHEAIRLYLEEHDIESRPVWKPMHMQPVFRDCRRFGGEVAAGLFECGLCLPSGSSLTEAQQQRIVALIREMPRGASQP